MKPFKYASREGFKAYGYDGLFRVPSVIVVTSLVDAKTKRKEPEEQRHKRAGKGFGEIFEEACNEQQDTISYHATGYTREARTIDYNYKKREYV